MLATIFSPSIDSATVKQCVGHMLQKMNYSRYRHQLYLADTYPSLARKFVVFEYTHSPFDAAVLQAEYVPGTRVPIHNVLQHPDFRTNMVRLFGDVNFYTRRKYDLSKPMEDRLTNTRQLVVDIVDTMPPLVPVTDMSGLNPTASPSVDYHGMPRLNQTVAAQPSQGGGLWGC